MNNPVVYDQSNNLQRQEVRKLLQKYKNKIIWRRDGKDLLDIGCGSGNITIDFLLPMLPSNFERLMGIDKSEKMVFHAREKNIPSRKSNWSNSILFRTKSANYRNSIISLRFIVSIGYQIKN